ncbi:Type I restriction modification DNA specificity domain [Vibrio sp. B1FIG11]|uniref:restriction endonuclease subunit S n=1 Tax=Vibrio sp. B1FIG11 TaxID=2751177 RepID=UPI001AF7DCB4|nr:restriction endonuclease subunit S [Vibrio sp. B1FIG11]CAD7825980.1 Type I restriction modification DNA specificity domain [Vibrio sp. B1FIG11]CAE6958639.1 Type I restriction modification DNA specificity domain [Vibrio sp. B1FIG11]
MVPDIELKPLGDITHITKLAGFEYTKHFDYSVGGEIIALRSMNIRNGQIDLSEIHTIPREVSDALPRSKLKKGDIVLGYVGSKLGNLAKVEEDERFHLAPNVALIRPNSNIDSDFLLQYMQAPYFQSRLWAFASSTGQPALSMTNVRKLPVILCSVKEQRKIAQILSTWDKAIASTEKLIDASKQQKKALMQQLLTGKKRLIDPETGKAFEGEWEEVKLKQIGKCITGLTYSPNDVVDEGTLVLRSSNIQGGKLSFLDNVYVSSHIKEESKTRVGDILICVRNGSRNLIGKSAYITDKASGQAHGAFMTVFRGKYAEFVFQLFQTVQFHRQVNKNLGATINSINTSDLHKFKFDFPKDKNEIEKIASVLTAADKDIELLEAKLSHFKQEKKALMQQLLTGKRRVKVAETEAA